MQDRYTGDVGDFGKYGLLRALCSGDGGKLRLGVNWHLVFNAGNPNDGKFVNYLCEDSPQAYLRNSDPQLYTLLQGIVFPKKNGSKLIGRAQEEADCCPRKNCPSKNEPGSCMLRRCVAKVEKRKILPEDTLFYNAMLGYPPNSTVAVRKNIRDSWVKTGFELLRDCDIVFFDPDNGLQVMTHSRYNQRGIQYAFDDEIAGYYKRGQSIIIYQHRSMEREDVYLHRIRKSITNITGYEDLKPIRLRYRRGTARDFIIIPNHRYPWHRVLIEERIGAMLPAWRGNRHDPDHFEKYYILVGAAGFESAAS